MPARRAPPPPRRYTAARTLAGGTDLPGVTGRLSGIAFYVGWAGLALAAVLLGLLLFQWVALPSLSVALPFVIGYGAIQLNRRRPRDKIRIVISDEAALSVGGPTVRDIPPARMEPWSGGLPGTSRPLYDWGPKGPPVGDLDDWVGRQVRRLKAGRMEIDAPAKSRVGREERVVVALGADQQERILTSVADGRQLQVDTIKVGTFMRVDLAGDAFDIVRPDNADKIVTPGHPARWDFRIVPKESGTQTLTVRAVVRLRLPTGDQEFYDLDPVERRIQVRVSAVYAVKRFLATPYVKFALKVWAVLVFLVGLAYAIDPAKEKINALLKPYVDWLFGLFS